MPVSVDNVNDMLEEWEQIRYVSSHISSNDVDILDYMRRKGQIMHYSQELRYARLINNTQIEQEYTVKFTEAYTTFIKDFVFKVLKNDTSPQF
jgi:hypothetical protein